MVASWNLIWAKLQINHLAHHLKVSHIPFRIGRISTIVKIPGFVKFVYTNL